MQQPYYNGRPVGANGSLKLANGHVGGFLAVTAGTITIVDGGGNAVLTAFPVAAGQEVRLELMFTPGDGATFTCAGGASGTVKA